MEKFHFVTPCKPTHLWHNPDMHAENVTIELRLKMPALWLLPLLLAAILLPNKVWGVLLFSIGGLYTIAALWARDLAANIQGSRQLKFGWMSVGDRLLEEFEVENNGFFPALWVEIVDGSNVPGYNAATVRAVGNGAIRWHQDAICQQRGQFHLGPWQLVSSDPFGIFRVTHHFSINDEIVIHPPIHTQLPVTLPAGQSSGQVRARQRAFQATINAAGIRSYQPHDPVNWIHWRKSAQTNQLQVRQFDLDAAGDIWLLLDVTAAGQLGTGNAGTEEQAVILAASLAHHAQQENRAVGLAAYSQQPQLVPPARGEGQQWRILRALALLIADGQTSLKTALRDLSRQVKRGSAVVLITPGGNTDWLPALLPLSQNGIRVNVILLDRASFGDAEFNTIALRDLLRSQGIACHTVQQGDIGMPAENQQQQGFWEFKVTKTGKVFTVNNPYE